MNRANPLRRILIAVITVSGAIAVFAYPLAAPSAATDRSSHDVLAAGAAKHGDAPTGRSARRLKRRASRRASRRVTAEARPWSKRSTRRKRRRTKELRSSRDPRRRCRRAAGYPAPLHSEAPTATDFSRAFVDPGGCKVTFNAVNMFPGWESGHYRSIRARGFNAIRLLLPWRRFEPARGQFDFKEVDAAVANARAAGLYVIIDTFLTDRWNPAPAWASYARPTGCLGNSPHRMIDAINTDGKRYLQRLVARYEHEDAVAAYDLVGEMWGSNDHSCLLRFQSNLIDWVREVDSKKIVVLEPGWGSGDPTGADVSQLRHRRNVVWSWHDYYAGDGTSSVFRGYNRFAMNAGHQTYDGVSGYPNPGDQADFKAQILVHARFARRARIALMGAGEYGINPEAPNAAAWMQQKTALYRRYGLSRAWWLYTCGESFGLKDDGCRGWRYTVDHLGLRG